MGNRLRSLCLILCVFVAACGGHSGSNANSVVSGSQPPPIAQTDADKFHDNDSCSLLDPKEVEAVLGAPLGTPPYRAQDIDPAVDGDGCIYQTADFHYLKLTVDFTDGAKAYHMVDGARNLVVANSPGETVKQALVADDGAELTGEWDEAQLVMMNCCTFIALRGDQMITIDFTATDATLRQSAGLVDNAFKRIDQPLKIDGASNVAAADAFLKTRPVPASPCMLSRAEAETVLGPLVSDPTPEGKDTCGYDAAPERAGVREFYELKYSWQGGYATLRSDAHVSNTVATGMGGGKTDADAPAVAASTGGAWEHAAIVATDFEAVKKDVLIQIDLRAVKQDKAKALVAAAMRKV